MKPGLLRSSTAGLCRSCSPLPASPPPHRRTAIPARVTRPAGRRRERPDRSTSTKPRAPAPSARTAFAAPSSPRRTSRTAPTRATTATTTSRTGPTTGSTFASSSSTTPRSTTTGRSRSSRTRTLRQRALRRRARPTARSRRWSPTNDVAWQAGNWWINTHSVGIENEGFALERVLLHEQALPLARAADALHGRALRHPARPRAHHRARPGARADRAFQAGMHWDPGARTSTGRASWRCRRADHGAKGDKTGRIVTIDPNFKTNQPTVTECDGSGSHPLPPQPANFVYLHTAPSDDAPLVDDPLPPRPGHDMRAGLGRQGRHRPDVRRRRAAGRLARDLVRRHEGVAARPEGQEHGRRQRHARHAEGRARVDPGLRPRLSVKRVDGDARLHDSRPGRRTSRRISSAPTTTARRRSTRRRRTRSSRATSSSTRSRSTTASRSSGRRTSTL